MTVAARLRKLIESQGFSISEAARAASMEKQQVHRIVSGATSNPGVETIERIVTAIGCTMAELYQTNEGTK